LDTFYRIRDYAKWYSNFYSVRRFLQDESAWHIPSEAELASNEETETVQGYSTIRMTSTGQILLMDAFNNTVEMNEEGLTLSSSQDVKIVSARDTSIIAGRNFNVLSRQKVNISSDQSNVNVTARENVRLISVAGRMFLESEGTYQDFGIVMRAKKGIAIISLENIEIVAKSLIGRLRNLFTINGKFNFDISANKIVASVSEFISSRIFARNIIGVLFNNKVIPALSAPYTHTGHVDYSMETREAREVNLASVQFPPCELDNHGRTEWYQPLSQQIENENIWRTESLTGSSGYFWPGAEFIMKSHTPDNINLDQPAKIQAIVTAKEPAILVGVNFKVKN